jgi:TonB-dependent SusC/RagA subfamily outer membrane receptor
MFFTKGNGAKAQGGIRKIGDNVQVVTVAELNKVRQTNINNALAGKVGKVAVNNDRIITGKVTDKDGNAVSFASVKVKGSNTGVSADANGAYSLKVNSNAVLIISGAGFIETEVPVGAQSVLNTVLGKAFAGEIVVFTGGICSAGYDDFYGAPDKTKNIAIIKVKDVETDNALHNARVVITKNRKSDTAITDQKGTCRIKGIKEYDNYFIKVMADGYEPNEFTINGSDFNERKKDWEVLLKKQKIQSVKVTGIAIQQTEKPIRLMGSFSIINKDKGPIYVVDGTIMPNGENINPDDIDNITVLQGPAAAALFGPEGANGAILITTKKLPVKNLDTVTVAASSNRLVGQLTTTTCTTTSVMGGMMKGITVKSTVTDSLKMLVTKITGAIKVYPNPVQEGVPFNVALKLKQTGLYLMQVTDATGSIVLQKQINANAREYTEKIMPDSRWSSGAYYISIIDDKNKPVNKCSFIFR